MHRRHRHGLQDNDICLIYDQAVESMDHIILGYIFSRKVWESWLKRLHLHNLVVVHEENIMQWWTSSKKRLPKTIHRGFDSVCFLIGWSLWKERNARTFNRIATMPSQLVIRIEEELDAWSMARYRHLGALRSLL